MHSTSATLQTWTKSGGGWRKVGPAVHAYLGSDGLTNTMSEFVSATPTGSYTLTQAFGRNADPGTALPYFRTTPADWWISQASSVYNTHQRCTSGTDGNGCGYRAPSEHLYYETPYYNYAVVIDYNTRNAGPVRPNAGSAVFLHVTVGQPTQGCVSIAEDQLLRIMRWLQPSAHPRILIGVD
jgi:L,D-peptidoglycan transpeptidase YkuD (ErfK/YbiS/YcfS/YnhG family)